MGYLMISVLGQFSIFPTFNLGLLYKVSGKVSVGAASRSRVNVPLDGEITLKDIASPLQPLFGESRFKTDADTTLHFPAHITVGVAYRSTKRWTLGFDVEWMDWSNFAKSRLDIERESAGS